MSKTRAWLFVLGGILLLMGVGGLYVSEIRGLRLYDPVLSWPRFVLWILFHWYWFFGAGLLLVFLGNGSRPIGHYCQLIDGLNVQPSVLYGSVRAQLKLREVPRLLLKEVSLRQRGLLSARRRHLRVSREYFRFDLCAALFGSDFGVSWRCYGRRPFVERALMSIPVLGWLLYFLFFRYTPYAEDQGLLFQSSVHHCVRRALDEQLKEKGLRALADESQPVLADMLGRWR